MGHTLFSAPKTIPENVTAEPTGNSTILVKWSSIGISSSEGFRGFSVRYEAEGHANWNGEKETGKIYNITLTELRMFTTYNIQVAARTTQPGNYSKAVSATTLEGGNSKKIVCYKVTFNYRRLQTKIIAYLENIFTVFLSSLNLLAFYYECRSQVIVSNVALCSC